MSCIERMASLRHFIMTRWERCDAFTGHARIQAARLIELRTLFIYKLFKASRVVYSWVLFLSAEQRGFRVGVALSEGYLIFIKFVFYFVDRNEP